VIDKALSKLCFSAQRGLAIGSRECAPDPPFTDTPEPAIGPRLARTRWADPPFGRWLFFRENYPSSVNPTRKVTW
jgi:hypothetical protein